MHNAHDHSYKLLFSEPGMIIDLLQGFVHEDWVKELDYKNQWGKINGVRLDLKINGVRLD